MTAGIRRTLIAASLGMVLTLAAGCGWHQINTTNPTNYLSQNIATKSVVLHVYAGEYGNNDDMNFDGYGDGTMTITIPRGWKVTVDFSNTDDTLSHSAMIVPMKDIGLSIISPSLVAFPGAFTPNPNEGTNDGVHVSFHFIANQAGRYALACGVPTHAQMGMWDYVVVSNTVSKASLKIASAK